jgi:beta-lactamase superfamily II metal-dependent hydrolase
MIDYGAPPEINEIEVVLFGPGYGEAIAIHLGDAAWMLVDSCIDPNSKEPAAGTYLERIGVPAASVRTIVASHWHDDHIRGISRLAAKHPKAEFFLSGVFNNKEAETFLAAFSGKSSADLARGSKELFDVLQARENVYPALHRSSIFEAMLNGRPVRVTALSPVPAAHAQSIAHFAQYLPRKNGAIGHAPEVQPNFEAVALHIDLGDDAVLLGADLEEHARFGWTAVIGEQWSRARKAATAYKVAHHGSYSGDCPAIWTTMLQPHPTVCLTPFTRGNLWLPTDHDKQRLKEKTPHAYISSGASRRPDMDSRQLKRLADVCKKLARVDAGFGAVRLRKTIAAPSWNVELFGTAQSL